ncbi:MAG: amidohydrolase family protein [Chloroflexi bacterium]|nr:amidohydrolase family protein [Chloroflexota bacterium]
MSEPSQRAVRIDAHHHFWPQPDPALYPWMTDDLAALRRPFSPDDLRPRLQARQIDRSILVQTRSSVEETREFLAIADRTDFVVGVVGWVDLTAPNVGEVLAELRAAPTGRWLAGIRHQVHDEPDPDWLRRSDVQRGLQAIQDAGLAYDLLLKPRELPAALAVSRAFPNLRLVIDHIAKPEIAHGTMEPWASDMAPFAELPYVFCKLSGMVTEADWQRWTPNDLLPYVERVIGWFGEDRLLYGSDWPVSTLAAPYERVHDALKTILDRLGVSAATQDKIFGANARRFYTPTV